MVRVTPTEITLDEGDNTSFICSATGVGADGFKYQWFLNDALIFDNSSALKIRHVSENTTGNYTCFVENSYGATGHSDVGRLYLSMYHNV